MIAARSVSPVKSLMNIQRRLLGRFATRMRTPFRDDEAVSAMSLPEAMPLNLAERRQVDLALRQWIHQREDSDKL